MSKKFTVLISVLITLLIVSGSIFLFFQYQELAIRLRMEGAQMAIQTVVNTAQKDGGVVFQTKDKDGKPVQIMLKLETQNEVSKNNLKIEQ